MEVVEDETPPIQHKLKDVSMDEVEDVQAQDSDKSGDEMEIFNIARWQRKWGRGGGGLKH